MVNDAANYEEEDKKRMEVVEARNGLESYVYNVRNSLQDEKTRDKLGANACDDGLATAKEFLDWIEMGGARTKAEYEDKQKEAEAAFRPMFAKLYDSEPTEEAKGPKIEEVD